MTSLAVECIFCLAKVGTAGGSLKKLERHLRQGHELHYKQPLTTALNFLSEQEIETLLTRLEGRIERYKAEGILEFQENIFTDTKQDVPHEDELDSSAGKGKGQDDMLDVAGAAEKINDLDENRMKGSDVQIPNGVKLKKVRVELTKIKYQEDFNEEIKGDVKNVSLPHAEGKNETIKMVSGLKKRSRHLEKFSPNRTNLISSEKYNHVNLVESFRSKGYCRLCYESCGDKRKLKKHETEQHSDETDSLARASFTLLDLIYKCDLCPQIPGFLTENLRNSHLDKDHKSRSAQRLICPVCKDSFQPSTFRAHLRSHKTDCSLCYKTFRRSKDLRLHQMRKHHGKQKSSLKTETENPRPACKLCYAAYSSQWNLQRHQVRHKEDLAALQRDIRQEELVFPCPDCDIRFLSEHLMSFHHQKTHKTPGGTSTDGGGGGKTYQCSLCYRQLRTLARYKSHKKVHKEDLKSFSRVISPSECSHQCRVCSLSFLSAPLLSYHLLRDHSSRPVVLGGAEKRPRWECLLCHLTYSSPGAVVKHCSRLHRADLASLNRRNVNTEQPGWACQQCGEAFLSQNLLRDHGARRHSGTRESTKNKKVQISDSHQCQLCYMKVKHKQNLKRHILLCHPQERKMIEKGIRDVDLVHSCKDCHRRFVSQSVMEYHRRVNHKTRVGLSQNKKKKSIKSTSSKTSQARAENPALNNFMAVFNSLK